MPIYLFIASARYCSFGSLYIYKPGAPQPVHVNMFFHVSNTCTDIIHVRCTTGLNTWRMNTWHRYTSIISSSLLCSGGIYALNEVYLYRLMPILPTQKPQLLTTLSPNPTKMDWQMDYFSSQLPFLTSSLTDRIWYCIATSRGNRGRERGGDQKEICRKNLIQNCSTCAMYTHEGVIYIYTQVTFYTVHSVLYAMNIYLLRTAMQSTACKCLLWANTQYLCICYSWMTMHVNMNFQCGGQYFYVCTSIL